MFSFLFPPRPSRSNFISKQHPQEILIRWDKDKNLSCEILRRVSRVRLERKKQLDQTDVPEDIEKINLRLFVFFSKILVLFLCAALVSVGDKTLFLAQRTIKSRVKSFKECFDAREWTEEFVEEEASIIYSIQLSILILVIILFPLWSEYQKNIKLNLYFLEFVFFSFVLISDFNPHWLWVSLYLTHKAVKELERLFFTFLKQIW